MDKKQIDRGSAKVLVTGASGFIGSHLSERLLENGHQVIAIDSLTEFYLKTIKKKNLEMATQNRNFKFQETDILDLESIEEGVEYIFHVAAQPGVRTSWGKDFDIYIRNNILATQYLLELCKDHKSLKKFIYSSSSSIYGETEMFPTKEETIPKPVSPYGVTKLSGEHLCQLYQKNFGIPVICLRYFTVFGPRQRPDMAFNRFIRAFLAGRPVVVYGDGEQSRDFTYVLDVVEANILAMGRKTENTIFNIGGGNYATINQVLDILMKKLKSDTEIRYEDRERGDVRDTKADISRAKVELGFNPKYDLEYGLKKEIEWIKSTSNIR